MSTLKFVIDAEKLAKDFGDLKSEVEGALEEGVRALSSMTHAKVVELASAELNSTRKKFIDSLSYSEIRPGVWAVAVDEKMLWLEDGKPAGSMVDDLLRKNAKVSKSGNRYKSIPFEHSKPKSENTASGQMLVNYLKAQLRKSNIPFKKLERNADGSPRLGKLHTLNFPNSPIPSLKAKTPAFMGVNIYQTKTSAGTVRRDIVTFRTVSDKHKAEGLWVHPGIEAKKFLDRSLEWAVTHWESQVLPEIMKRFE
jgi:hypothetical protein